MSNSSLVTYTPLFQCGWAEFPNRDWPAIEHWAEKGLLKPDVWKARRTNLSLIVKLKIPISGTAIQIQQQALQLDQVPDSWPCNLESGWAAHYGRLDMPFKAMCQHLVQNQFTSDAFQGDSDSYLFQWDTNVWESWPEVDGHNFKEDWDKVFFFARRPIGSCNLVLFIHHWLMRGRKSVHNSRIGAKPFLHCET